MPKAHSGGEDAHGVSLWLSAFTWADETLVWCACHMETKGSFKTQSNSQPPPGIYSQFGGLPPGIK